MSEEILAGKPGRLAWQVLIVPTITVLLLVTAVVYVLVDPAKLIETVKHHVFEGVAFAVAWFVQLHLAVRVSRRDDDTLIFEGAFRRWDILPSDISKFVPLGSLVAVRHANGFLLLPTSTPGGESLVRWVSDYRKRHGFDTGGDS